VAKRLACQLRQTECCERYDCLVGSNRKLLAVLACPPTTSGNRTRNRVAFFADLFNFASFEIVNLVDVKAYRTNDLTTLAVDSKLWARQRRRIKEGLSSSDACLFAYGVSKPSGQAGKEFAQQIDWLQREVDASGIDLYRVGDAPRHPSRWHRLTSKDYPEVPFANALGLVVQKWDQVIFSNVQ
jgi:hypothetical protein